jgi:hypothetical protein
LPFSITLTGTTVTQLPLSAFSRYVNLLSAYLCVIFFLCKPIFQISHSWDICQRYYENPDWANRPEGRFYSDDDDMDLAEEDLFEFYM